MSADPPSDSAPQAAAAASAPSAAGASAALPADVLAEVEREQALADVQASLSAVESAAEQLKKEKEAVSSERDAAVSTADQLRTQLASLQSAHHQSASELRVSQSRIDAAEREKRELVEERERLQQRANRATQDLYTLRTQKSEASQKNAQYEVEVSELKMAADSAKFREQRALQALESSRAEITNLSKASADLETRFSQYRVKSQADYSEIQLENERLQARVTSIESAHQALQRSYGDQSRRLADAVANVASLTTSSDSKRNEFRLEFERLMEENRLLKKHSDEARAAVAQRETDLEALETELADSEQRWSDRLQREARARQEAEKRADDHKVVLQRMASDTSISPTANLLSQIGQDGKSFTQFYAEHALLQDELGKKEQEISRLESALERILADIKEKQEYFTEREEDYDKATERANTLATELASTQQQRDALQDANKTLESAVKKHVEDIRSSQVVCEDLSRQVQALVREIEVRDDPRLASVAFDTAPKVSEGDIISDRLVMFKALPALQQQNVNLLGVTRRLQAKLEALVVGRASTEEDDGISDLVMQAHSKLEQAHGRINEIQGKLIEVTRERDTFSRLLSRGEGLRWPNGSSSGGPSADGPTADGRGDSAEEALSNLQSELDVLRKRSEDDIAEAKLDARKHSEAASAADIARAKAEAKASVLEEQVRIAQDTNNLQQGQITNLESQLNQLQYQLAQTQQERRKALEDVVSHQAAETRLRNEAARLQAEKEQWETVQTRLQSDFAAVQQERARLQHTIENLTSLQGENERTRAEERAKLERRIDELQRETTTLRAQVDQAREAKAAAERKVEESDSRIASETAALRSEKEAAEATVASKTSEINTLNEQIAAKAVEVENATKKGLKWQRRSRELEVAAEAATAAATAAKEVEVNKLRTDVEEALNRVAEVEKQLAEAEQARQANDSRIAELETELAAAKESSGQPTAASNGDDAALAAIQAERDSLQERLTTAEKELAAAKASATVPADGDAAKAIQTQLDETAAKLAETEKALSERNAEFEQKVTMVNKSNRNMKNTIDKLNPANKALVAEVEQLRAQLAAASGPDSDTVTKLQAEIAQLKTQLAAASGADSGAIQTALAAREAELKKEHDSALAAANASAAEATKAAVMAREAELKKEHGAALAAASASAPAQDGEGGGDAAKIALLEKQLLTSKRSRTVLERTIESYKTKLEKFTAAAAAGANGAALSPSAPAFQPGKPVATPPAQAQATPAAAAPTPTPATPAAAAPSAAASAPAAPVPVPTAAPATTPAAPAATPTTPAAVPAATAAPATDAAEPSTPTTPAAPTRGRGRGRAMAIRGRGTGRPNSVLSAVNATLSAPEATTSTNASTKRPAPEEGEVTSSPGGAGEGGAGDGAGGEAGAGAGAGAGGDILQRLQGGAGEKRAAKRPRGGMAGRGGRGGRRGGAPEGS